MYDSPTRSATEERVHVGVVPKRTTSTSRKRERERERERGGSDEQMSKESETEL
jgi:hypothetical protein